MTYQAVVDFLSLRIAGDLPPFVCGWRLRRDVHEPGAYAHNNFEWSNHRKHLVEFSRRYSAALTTDIVSFFASVDLRRLAELVEARTRSSRTQRRLLAYFATFEAATERPGLPQRSTASSLLANAYLGPLDELLLDRSQHIRRRRRSDTHSVVRWMDDIWLFGDDVGDLRNAQVEIESTLWELSLTLNTAKTEILEGDELRDRARQREHSGVEAQLANSAGDDLTGLRELVERIVAAPERVSRSTYRFVLARVEQWGLVDVARELVEIAHRAPHAADSFAHAFRRLGLSQELVDCYLEYRGSAWRRQLACAHFATMFPHHEAPPAPSVRDALEEDCLASDLPRATVGLTRLVAWDQAAARLAIREASRHADHALMRRSLALAALNAHDERTVVRRLLRSHPENAALLEAIESGGFQQFPVPRAY